MSGSELAHPTLCYFFSKSSMPRVAIRILGTIMTLMTTTNTAVLSLASNLSALAGEPDRRLALHLKSASADGVRAYRGPDGVWHLMPDNYLEKGADGVLRVRAHCADNHYIRFARSHEWRGLNGYPRW